MAYIYIYICGLKLMIYFFIFNINIGSSKAGKLNTYMSTNSILDYLSKINTIIVS